MYQLKDIENILVSSKDSTKEKSIEDVVIALGTNDITNSSSQNSTVIDVQQAVHTISETFPEAHVYMSSITPRYHRGWTKSSSQAINRKIDNVNDFMAEWAKTNETLHHIKNQGVFETGRGQEHKIYSATDSKGVHLTAEGKKKLLSNILVNVAKIKSKHTPARAKRPRSEHTPPTAEKDQKTRKV